MPSPPDLPVYVAVAALIGFMLGALSLYVLARRSRSSAFSDGRAGRESEIAQLAAERDLARQVLERAQQDADQANRQLAEARDQATRINAERATLAGRMERLPQVEAELATARTEATRSLEARQRAEQRTTELATRLHEQQQSAQEKLALLDRAREQLADSFKALAAEFVDKETKRFTEHSATQLGQLLNPLREQLGDFRKRVDEVHDKENLERGLLKREIESLKTLNQRIGEDALNLTRALKGESKTQGAWGELILERLLEASGLQKGREYETQIALKDDVGGRPRPDVIVHLPEGRDLIIDAKVSLTAYERHCSAADDAERRLQLDAHLASMRNHVKQLAERRYSDLPGVNTLEFVLMFVPVEAAYIEAMRHDDTLYQFALERQVAIVTTSTLLATLRTVASLWRFDDRNRNALEIADRAGKLYDKFVGFVEDIQDAKNKLEAARDALDAASSKLGSGRGNLVGQVEKLRELGAKTGKSLDAALLERAQAEEPPRLDVHDSQTEKGLEPTARRKP